MIDGRSAYVDAQGVAPWKAIPVALVEIERIEVLKGPAGVIYGFNAFDGIVREDCWKRSDGSDALKAEANV